MDFGESGKGYRVVVLKLFGDFLSVGRADGNYREGRGELVEIVCLGF